MRLEVFHVEVLARAGRGAAQTNTEREREVTPVNTMVRKVSKEVKL